jgi:hypothetical protein
MAPRFEEKEGERQVIPDESKAAGLMVPDPSINSFPMPLSDLETEGVVWYMAAGQQRAGCEATEGRIGAALPDPPGCRAHKTCDDHTTLNGWLRCL